jgi:ribosomal subunit interface protein
MKDAKISITFRHGDPTPAFDNYAREHIQKLDKFLATERTPIIIELVLDPHRTHAYNLAELRVKTPNYDLNVSKEANDMYLAIDQAVDAMLHALATAKRKRVDEQKGDVHRPG